MNFNLEHSIQLLSVTPDTFQKFIGDLPSDWLLSNEGEGTWNVVQVIDHLIEAEKMNWIPRLKFILENGSQKPFPAFDRFAHLNNEPGKSIQEKLDHFKSIRTQNINELQNTLTSDQQLNIQGYHPAFGNVNVKQLIATWTVHDLTHISQISRILAFRYKNDVGPWKEYLGILK